MSVDYAGIMSPLDDTTIVAHGDGWLSAQVGHEYVMMSEETGTCISLSETGRRVWELMEAPQSIWDLCATLASEYDAPMAAIRFDVLAFLDQLQREKALKTE